MILLQIDSSALGAHSVTRELTAAVVARWTARDPGIQIEYRDLDRDPVVHLSGRTLGGTDLPARADAERSLQQFLDADVVVIGAPMYNFAVPSTLKAWIDRIAVAGKTFRYTDAGPEGPASAKRVIVAVGSGGRHARTPGDFVEPYLRAVFRFMGVRDIEFVRAQGVALSPAHRSAALAEAHASIATIATMVDALPKAA